MQSHPLFPTSWSSAVPGSPSAAWTDLDRVFRDFLRGIEPFARPAPQVPRLNVWTTDEALFVEAAVPGLTEDEIRVSVHGDKLWLESNPRSESEEDRSVSYHRRERTRTSFRRSIPLPVRVDAEKVSAKLSHGLLTIQLPKATEARARQIEVRATGA